MSKCGGLHCPGCDSGGGAVLLIIGAVLLLSAGGATALVHTAEAALWAAFAVTLLTVAAGGVWVVYRARHPALVPRNPSQEGLVRLPGVRMPARYELPDPQRAAIGQAAPRELHQHVHYHWHGADEDRQAEIQRRQEG